jgi:hypothetical protein
VRLICNLCRVICPLPASLRVNPRFSPVAQANVRRPQLNTPQRKPDPARLLLNALKILAANCLKRSAG